MKVQKSSFGSIVLFCLSPIFSLPILLYNIKRGNKIAVRLFAVFFGIVGNIN